MCHIVGEADLLPDCEQLYLCMIWPQEVLVSQHGHTACILTLHLHIPFTASAGRSVRVSWHLQYCGATQQNSEDDGTGAVLKCLVAANQSLTSSCLSEVQRTVASALLLYQPVSLHIMHSRAATCKLQALHANGSWLHCGSSFLPQPIAAPAILPNWPGSLLQHLIVCASHMQFSTVLLRHS